MGGSPLRMEEVVVSPAWEEIARKAPHGLIMIIGGADTGKSTFARWLLGHLAAASPSPIGFLDGDPGQSTLGPPTTVTLAFTRPGTKHFPLRGRRWRRCVGSTSPRDHMLPLLSGVARLVEVARSRRVKTIVYDTTGLIDPRHGGVALKLAKIELLRPDLLIAIRRSGELEPLIAPLRRSNRIRISVIEASPALRHRSILARQRHRVRRFAEQFAGAVPLEIETGRYAIFPHSCMVRNQLLAFEDAQGFTVALGIAIRTDETAKTATILTPIRDLARVDSIRLADLKVHPVTFRDAII
jgi:polynucleotide 5'-hydroxyl-kinase GRC3/NOL9